MNVSSILQKALALEIKTEFGFDSKAWLSSAQCLSSEKMKDIDRLLVRVLDEYGSRDKLYAQKPLVFALSDNAKRLKAVRTLLNYTYKVEVTPTKTQIAYAQEKFLERNKDCAEWSRKNVTALRGSLGRDYSELDNSDSLVQLLAVARWLCYNRTAQYRVPGRPGHGPGVTSNAGSRRIDKYASISRDVPASLRRFALWFMPSPSFQEEFQPLSWNSECKLRAVSKDMRGPRLIAPHSAAHMWMQQAVRDRLCDVLTRDDRWYKYHPLLDEQISTIQFDDQLPNAALALFGSSRPGLYGTIDLSDASDRIPWLLARTLLPRRLARDLTAVRARSILVDDKSHRLHMHAPMGSACCFPVLSLICWSVSCAAIWLETHTPSALKVAIPSEFESVWVFGDDIIIPPHHYQCVEKALSRCNLMVSANKSFCGSGGFRESCGVDAYGGEDVTPVRLRVDGVSSRADLLSLIAHANRLREEGLHSTAKACRDLIEIIADQLECRSLIGATSDTRYSATCIILPLDQARAWNRAGGVVRRYNKKLQRAEIRAMGLRDECSGVNSDLDSRSRLFEGVLGNRARQLQGWSRNRPRSVVTWVPFW